MAIFRELLHGSPLDLPRAAWLARWLATVFRFTGRPDGNALVPAQPAQAPYTRALFPFSSAIQSIAAMRASPNYVLAALYLLGDANAQRSRYMQNRECRAFRRSKISETVRKNRTYSNLSAPTQTYSNLKYMFVRSIAHTIGNHFCTVSAPLFAISLCGSLCFQGF